MSTYSIVIKKGKYELSVTTSDKEMIEEQFASWIKDADVYTRKYKVNVAKERINHTLETEENITRKAIEEQLNKYPQQQLQVEDTKKVDEKQTEKDDSLNVFYASSKITSGETVTSSTINNINSTNSFDYLLEQKMNTPQTELKLKSNPVINKDESFIKFLQGRKPDKTIDYLLLCAYYLTQYEQKQRFTLKQLNTKLMQNVAILVDHNVLQEAINRDYIECLPDLTGLVGASEYRLTSYGEKTILDA